MKATIVAIISFTLNVASFSLFAVLVNMNMEGFHGLTYEYGAFTFLAPGITLILFCNISIVLKVMTGLVSIPASCFVGLFIHFFISCSHFGLCS